MPHTQYHLFLQAPIAIIIISANNYAVEMVNDHYKAIANTNDIPIGTSIFQSIPSIQNQGIKELMDDVFATGKPYYGKERLVHLTQPNAPVDGYFNFVYQPYFKEGSTKASSIMVVATDVTEQVNARQKIQTDAAMVHHLLMNAPGFVCTLVGPTHVYDLVNPRYQALFGKREIKGKAILDALPELAGQGFDVLLDKVYATGIPYIGIDIPITMAKDEGLAPQLQYFNFSYQPMYDVHKNIYAILVFGYEVTEQVEAKNKNLQTQQNLAKQLEQSVQQRTAELMAANQLLQKQNQEIGETKEKLLTEYSRSLIEATLDPLITITTGGIVTDVNKAFETITQKTRTQIIGTDFGIYFTEPQKARDIYKEVMANGFVTNYPLTVIDSVPTDVIFNGSVYKNENGTLLGAVVVARDVTEQMKYQTELQQAKTTAETAAKVAEDATKLAEHATKSKQQFLANMSHEIRTPMNAIIGFSKVALKTILTPKQQEYLNAIKISGDTLIVLINDILDLAKVDAGKMTFEETPFKLSSSISAMLHLFESKIQEKNLALVVEYDATIPDVLIGDAIRLHQIILNLFSNAVKFTNQGSITFKVQVAHHGTEKITLVFYLTDTGIGIKETELKSIFENFNQASTDTSRLYGGTGLGLAISKQLIELQGGNISVSSQLGQGSTFKFELSFKKNIHPNALLIEDGILDTYLYPVKVLVVEDMPLNQLLMKTLLEDFNFECHIVANGKIAIKNLRTTHYDIILMDLQMPEMNGFEATEYIRNIMQSNIPIIALTADVTTVDINKCKAAGMNDYLAKPVDEKILYTKIITLLKEQDNRLLLASKPTQPPPNTTETARYTNLQYLSSRTKNNKALLTEMINVYLQQTPPLLHTIKQSLQTQDWPMLNAAIHKILPSFGIMGFTTNFENIAKQIKEYAAVQEQTVHIQQLVTQIETACTQAIVELQEELKKINPS